MFRFHYKLTALIACIVLVLLSGTFLILQRQIEENAVATINTNLKDTRSLVSRLMDDRQVRLWEIATGLAGAELVRVILNDPTLDQLTRDDILEAEILPDYPQLDLLGVIGPEGEILALNALSQELTPLLLQQEFLIDGLYGEAGSGFLIHQNRALQMVALPLTIRFEEEEEILGLLLVGLAWTQKDVERIKALSRADILFFEGAHIFLATQISLLTGETVAPQALTDLFRDASRLESAEPESISIQAERFLYFSMASDQAHAYSPPYIILKSLDQQLAFVKKIRDLMAQFGALGIGIGFIVAFLFARGISRPITDLQGATSHVERGNLDVRVHIRSRDEFALLGRSFNRMVEGLLEKERIRGVMNKVVSKEIADEILRGDLQLGGEERTATILFSDIRGFTTLSEMLNPRELLDILNAYFTRVSTCIYDHQGNIDKYLGDAIMALFGVPIGHDHDALSAVLAALDMIDALERYNQTLAADFGKALRIGIGINTGKLVAGLMGASNRMEYSVLGDEVNLASRLEGITKQYGAQIIISESTYTAMQNSGTAAAQPLYARALDTVRVKGKTRGVKIYQVFARHEMTPRLAQHIERFEQARELLETRQFEESLRLFNTLEREWPDDTPTRVFRTRALAYAADPALFEQEYQQGVYVFTTK